MTEISDNQRELETMTISFQQVMKQAQQRIIELEGVNIHGKEYKSVNIRIKVFREFFPNFSLTSDILVYSDNACRVKASVISPAHRVMATGHAEEDKNTNHINKTSMLENCETSAWGRALANFGLQGDELASANERERAKAKEDVQKQKASEERVNNNFNEKGKLKKKDEYIPERME